MDDRPELSPIATHIPPEADSVLRSPGRPLEPTTREYMEPRFGRDLGNVRVHDDAPAAASARAVGARAYTVGSHVVFGAGRYAPATRPGRELLGHELAHTIQQRRGGGAPPSAEPAEASAREAGRAVAGGAAAPALPASGVGLARSPDDKFGQAFTDEEREAEIERLSERLKTPSYPGRDHDRRWLIALEARGDTAKQEALEEAHAVIESVEAELADDDAPAKPLRAEQRFANRQVTEESVLVPEAELDRRIAGKQAAAAAAARQKEDDERPQRLIALRNTLINQSGMKRREVAALLADKYLATSDIQLLRRHGLPAMGKRGYLAADVLKVVEKTIAAEGISDPESTTYTTRPTGIAVQQKYAALNQRQDEATYVKQSITGVASSGPVATFARPPGAFVAWLLGYDPLKGSEVAATFGGVGDVALGRRSVTPRAAPPSSPPRPVAAEIRPAVVQPMPTPSPVAAARVAPAVTPKPAPVPGPPAARPAPAAKPQLLLPEPSPVVRQRDVVAGKEAAVQEKTATLNARAARVAEAERDLDAARRRAAEAALATQRAQEAAERARVAAAGAKRTSQVSKDATQARNDAGRAAAAQAALAKEVKRAGDALFKARKDVATEAERAKRARAELKTSREQLERHIRAAEPKPVTPLGPVRTGKDVLTGGTTPLTPGRTELGQYGIDRYGTFSNRPGDRLAGHEVLQNLWLEVHGHATRLGGAASRNNPAVALSQAEHAEVGRQQIRLGLFDRARLARMSAQDVIDKNVEAMRAARIPSEVVETIKREAERHARALGL